MKVNHLNYMPLTPRHGGIRHWPWIIAALIFAVALAVGAEIKEARDEARAHKFLMRSGRAGCG